jgi:cullin 4
LKYILPSGPAKQPSISYGEALSTVSFLAPDTVQAEELLKKTENALMSCVASITHTLLDPILLSKEPAQWLIHYIQKWQWYVQRTDLLCAVMVGLDRGYVQAHRSTSLGQIGKEKWKAGPLSKGLVMIQLRKSIKQWIDEERETGVPVNRDLIKLLISSLLAVGSYTTLFETTVEDITTSFYRQEAKSWHSKSPVDFLEHAEKRVLQEEERCQQVFPLPSSHVVVSAAEQELWGTQSQAAWISSEAVPDLLKAALKHDANASDGTASPDPSPLVRLHKLFARTGTLENLYAALRDHLDAITSDLVKTAVAKPAKQRKDGDVEQDIISDLMNLKGLLEDVARFLSDKQINQVVDAVYTRSFAEKSGKVAELMAKHIDKALRAKKPSEDGLRRVLDMYRYTPGEF